MRELDDGFDAIGFSQGLYTSTSDYVITYILKPASFSELMLKDTTRLPYAISLHLGHNTWVFRISHHVVLEIFFVELHVVGLKWGFILVGLRVT